MGQNGTALATLGEGVLTLDERRQRIFAHANDAAIEIGHELIAAKADHPGTFTAWVTQELPFGIDTAERIMAIARCHHLNEPGIRENLPSGWTALYQLSRPPIERLRAAVESGEVHPDMTYKEAASWASDQNETTPTPEPSPSPVGEKATPRVAADLLAKELLRYPRSELSGEMLVALRRWVG